MSSPEVTSYARITLEHEGRRHSFIQADGGHGLEAMRYWWEEGNGACDCNRSLELPWLDVKLPCGGDQVELVDFQPLPITLLQGGKP